MAKQPAPPDDVSLPLWAERDVAFKKLSATQQQELRQTVGPLFQRLANQSDDPLAHSCSLSISHLIWSELLKQCELARLSYCDSQYSESPRGYHFGELFRLLDAKCQLSSLLIRLRQNPLEPLTAVDTNHARFPIDAALLPPPISQPIT